MSAGRGFASGPSGPLPRAPARLGVAAHVACLLGRHMGPVVCTQDVVCRDRRESALCPWGCPTEERPLGGRLRVGGPLSAGPMWGGRGGVAGLRGPCSPPAGDDAAPLGRGTSRATCEAAGWRSPWRPTPSPCSAWPASWPVGSCTCIATTTCTGEAGRGCWLSAASAPAQTAPALGVV